VIKLPDYSSWIESNWIYEELLKKARERRGWIILRFSNLFDCTKSQSLRIILDEF